MFPETRLSSPNVSPYSNHERLGVCFHHTVLTFAQTIEHMLNPGSRVSYHVVIDGDGSRCTLAADNQVAWHAGVSFFAGRSRCNDFLLGCAFAGDSYQSPLTEPQLASALEWLEVRWHRHGWRPSDMTDHRQISPGRKDDLNPVEWTRLIHRIRNRFGDDQV